MQIISRKDALKAGLKFFYTGKPCINGHLTQRYTSIDKCVGCSRAVNAKLREATKLRRAERPLSVRQQAKADGKKWYEPGTKCKYGHIEPRLVSTGMCAQCSRDQSNAFVKKHPDRRKKYVKANEERYRCHARNRKAKIRNAGAHTQDDIAALFKAQGGKCAYCKKSLKQKYHVDHIVPISKGGLNSKLNLQLTCPKCNLTKFNHDPQVFARKMGLLL